MAMQRSRRDFFKVAGLVAGGAVATGVGAQLAWADEKTPAGLVIPQAAATDPWDEVPTILARIIPPTFPAKDFRVTDYGAKGDGKTDCTAAFKKAITACNAAGGGRVVVPSGTYSTGAIQLLSNVNLFVDSGATIKFSTDPGKYLPVVFTRWQGIECYNYSAFIYARGQSNLAITGKGTLDGQGASWKSFGSGGSDWTKLQQQGADNTPVDKRVYGSGHKLRPNLIELQSCTNILLEDFTAVRPPMWCVHPVLSRNITVRGLNLSTRNGGGNNDGCDPECCSDVHIVGCTFDTGDDCIAIKSGRDVDGRRVGVASENIVIEDCVFKFSNRGAICVGSECSGGARNIFARNSQINPANAADQLWYALFVKTGNHRGGTLDGIHLQNITGNKFTKSPILITLKYSSSGPGPVAYPTVRNITLDNLTMKGSKEAAVEIVGLPQSHVSNVSVSNSVFTGISSGGNRISNADGVTFTKTTINGKAV
jgi:polygalacturonase